MSQNGPDLPVGWVQSTVGERCQVVSGATPKTGEPANWGGEINWLTPDDLSKNRSKVVSSGARTLTQTGYDSCSTSLVPAGTVVFSSRAPIGYVAIAGGELCTNQGFKSAIPDDSLTSEFLYWHLQQVTPDIRSRASGTTFLEISKKGFAATEISVPPLEEQERIVEVLEEHLSHLDAALASIQTVRTKAAQFRRSLLHNTLAGGGAVGWRTCTAGDVVSFLNGYAFKSEWYVDQGVNVVRGQNISHGHLDWSDQRQIAPARAEEFERFRLNAGDVLVALDRPLISTGLKWAVVSEADLPALLLQRVARLAPDKTRLDPGFLACWLQSPFFVDAINPGRSAGVPHISTGEISSLPMSLPSVSEQERIVEDLRARLSQVDATLAAADRVEAQCAALRRSLLHAAFTGKLTEEWRENAHV